jgi:2-keto-4-pentenoate hydratase/2-oxohepta-3-ene-1,7-dioic acid hydratase in catechol pathway
VELVTFVPPGGGTARIGVHRDGEVIDLERAGDGRLPQDMLGLLAGGDEALAAARAAAGAAPQGSGYALADVELLAPIPRPGKVLALAANYADHVIEGGGTVVRAEGRMPLVFCKLPSSVIGPGAPILLPRDSKTVDWELELGAVIGRRAKHVAAEDALSIVAGYVVGNDVSARTMEYADRTQLAGPEEWFDFINGKWCDSFAALGPYLVTADEIADPDNLSMRLSVNGVVRQDGSTGQMIFKLPEIIAFVTRWATLEPGDVIITGTPGGTGEATDTYLQAGDTVEATIEGLGTLVNPVRADS